MLTPTEVARKANVSVQTVRNYTREYADLLSPTARGEVGTRLFSDEDVEVFCTIAALRKSGVPPGEIAQRIRDNEAPPIIDVTPQAKPQEATEGPQTAIEATPSPQAQPTSLEVRVVAVETVNDMILKRLDAMRDEQKDRINYGITMLVIGAALMLVAVALATLLN